MIKNRAITCLLVPPQGARLSIRETLMVCCVAVSRGCARSRGEGEVRRFVLVSRSKQIFMFGRFDDVLESARAPSGLRQLTARWEDRWGGMCSRMGGGAAHLLSEGVFFGRERKSHRRRKLIVACVGGFSPPGVASSRFWRRSGMRK